MTTPPRARARRGRTGEGGGRRWRIISRRCRRSSIWWRNSASRPIACSASGTGSGGAIRSGRHRARAVSPSAATIPRIPARRHDAKAFRADAAAGQYPRADGLLESGIATRGTCGARRHSLRPAAGAVPGLSPAARHGVERQVGHARRRACEDGDRARHLGRAGHQWTARVLQMLHRERASCRSIFSSPRRRSTPIPIITICSSPIAWRRARR